MASQLENGNTGRWQWLQIKLQNFAGNSSSNPQCDGLFFQTDASEHHQWFTDVPQEDEKNMLSYTIAATGSLMWFRFCLLVLSIACTFWSEANLAMGPWPSLSLLDVATFTAQRKATSEQTVSTVVFLEVQRRASYFLDACSTSAWSQQY